jgi:bifunctional UDP-N-acetylglucosamine pyrophosphorylase/glucosamine-1-phosphate N-acetyltransferase
MDLKNETIEKILLEESKKEQNRLKINLKHIESGVKFLDWKNAYIDDSVVIGEGTFIGPGVVIKGNTVIGQNCTIDQNTRIENSKIADDVSIQLSVIIDSEVGSRSKIGPFAYLRPNSKIGEDVKVGDFVEVKNSTIGNGSKASHLTYIGDSDIGEGVNLGCGVIFVNYDGINKHRSTVEDGAFIGCNTNIISPVKVSKGAYVAAGTTVTRDVPEGSLCIGREKEIFIEGWVERRGIIKKRK